MYCHHDYDMEALDHFWALCNPELKDCVERARLIQFLDYFIKFAVEIPYEVLNNNEKGNKEALEYIKAIAVDVYKPKEQLRRELPELIPRFMLRNAIDPQKWFNTYKIRCYICPEKGLIDD